MLAGVGGMRGACMVAGGESMRGGGWRDVCGDSGACVVAGGVCGGRLACMVVGGMHGGGRGHAWWHGHA